MRIKHFVIATLILVSGCYRAVGARVTELPDGRLSIEAVESEQSDQPCVYPVRVYRLFSQQRTEIWNIALTEQALCVGAFTYPETPPGYEVVVPLDANMAPAAGDTIEVEISGAGFNTSTRLTKQ